MDDRTRKIVELFKMMPGRPTPRTFDGNFQWQDMEGCDHWEFCAAIVDLLDYELRAKNGGLRHTLGV